MLDKQKLKAKYGNEKIFVVPYESIEFIEDKFTPIEHDPKIWSKFDSLGSYMPRYDVEGEPYVQQIIPYIVITNNDKSKLFTTKRLAGDARLTDKISIACGGHIDESDGNKEVLFKAAVREIFEEVDTVFNKPFEIIGYVRDKNSSTNDHVGVVIIATTNEDVSIKESDNLSGEWMSIDEVSHYYEKLEGWSKYIVDHFVLNNKIC